MKNHVKPSADLIACANFFSPMASEMHIGIIISYHSLALRIRDFSTTLYADARRRNGDYYGLRTFNNGCRYGVKIWRT